MATISFFARGVGNIAAGPKPVLDNLNKPPSGEITFTDNGTGDLKLETNGGLPDPDTNVIIDGVEMSFILEFSGYLPTTSKFQNVAGADLRGVQVAVITASNGNTYIFITDGSASVAIMNALPTGQIALDNVSTTAPVLVCFLRGTLIDTPQGQRRIETLQPGDLISTFDGRDLPLRWIGHRDISATDLLLYPELRPIVLPQDMFGPGLPARRLKLSASHRLAIGGWEAELLFGTETLLMRANHLLGHGATRVNPHRDLTYYHLLLDEHTLVLANGLACETFQLGARTELALAAEDLAALATACPGHSLTDLMHRPDCFPTLKSGQANLLLNWAGEQSQTDKDPLRQTVTQSAQYLAA